MGWLSLAAVIAGGQDGAAIKVVPTSLPQIARQEQDLDQAVQVEDVEVFGRRGAALTSPEIELDGADIDALGVWDINEVLERMAETLSLGERPMVLINGQPTPNVDAYKGFPPGALARAEVLPPQAAGMYGAAPGQRVVNLVLQPKFSSYDGRVAGSRPTQGGTSSLSGDLRRSAIAGRNTHQVGLRLSRDTALRTGERDYDLSMGRPSDERVTLRPHSDSISLNGNLTRAFGDWSSVFTVNAQTQDSRPVVRLAAEPVESSRRSDSLAGSAGLSGRLAGWLLQGNFNARASRRHEDGLQNIRSDMQSLALTGNASRPLFDLPTGIVTLNLSGNLEGGWTAIDRDQTHVKSTTSGQNARGTLAIPLTKAGGRSLVGPIPGDLVATLGGGVRQVGGDGGDELSAGLSWTPLKGFRLTSEWSALTEGVSDNLKSEPIYYGSPIVVFDFRTGEAVEILPIRGGNPDLRPPQFERLSIGASAGPFTPWAVTGNLGYQRAVSTDGVGSLPALTEDVEIAFPELIQRDAEGRLVSIDYRPMNLSSGLSESLNAGFNFSLPRPAGGAGEPMVLRVALNYGLQLANVVRLRAGLPEMDRLKGDGGGLSPQNARIMIDARRGPWGANATAQWQDGYRTRRISAADGPDDLVVAPFTSVDLRFSFQMASRGSPTENGQGGGGRRANAGLQVNLDIANLFDARPEARLAKGSPAPGYGRDVQDPIGRMVRVTLQRRF